MIKVRVLADQVQPIITCKCCGQKKPVDQFERTLYRISVVCKGCSPKGDKK